MHASSGQSLLLNLGIEQKASYIGLGTIHGLLVIFMDPCFVLGNPRIVQIHTLHQQICRRPANWTREIYLF